VRQRRLLQLDRCQRSAQRKAPTLRALVTHRFALDRIEEAYDLFANQRDGMMKVAITPA